MADPTDSQVLNYFENHMRDFITKRLSDVDNWWKSCVPPEIREETSRRHEDAKKINDVLNKPDFGVDDYLNFDAYQRIISRRDNWTSHFEPVFRVKPIFEYKMGIILNLRNDIMHGRSLDGINRLRLKLHCYDILSQIRETDIPHPDVHKTLAGKLGLDSYL